MPPSSIGSGPKQTHEVTFEELVAVMQHEKGYAIAMTTNAVRFQIYTIAHLIDWIQRTKPQIQTLTIDYTVWFKAYLKAAGLDESAAPKFMRIAYKYKQNYRIDIKKKDAFDISPENVTLHSAAEIQLWWDDANDAPKRFWYKDMNPYVHMRVINERNITYRLLNFGDMIVCDTIEGLKGRPISGILGVMFKVLGDVTATQIRMSISNDGLQLTRVYTQKGLITVKVDTTIYPNGRGIINVPRNRPDLEQAVSRLALPLKIKS